MGRRGLVDVLSLSTMSLAGSFVGGSALSIQLLATNQLFLLAWGDQVKGVATACLLPGATSRLPHKANLR